jgi:hypothetical protein
MSKDTEQYRDRMEFPMEALAITLAVTQKTLQSPSNLV